MASLRTKLSAEPDRLHSLLLGWYDDVKRDLPWRSSNDPYAVWVSEIMLQQTTVKAVVPYFERWISRFPTVESLAEGDVEEVLSLWAGLGYYSRGRRLLEGARTVVSRGWPLNAAQWRSMPGVGRYTAAAIASIGLAEAVALVDGNVERVFSRLNADPSVGAELRNRAWEWADSVVHRTRPGDWNQALMELGATVCKPRNPDCHACPLQGCCLAFRAGDSTGYPRSQPRKARKKLKHFIWAPVCDGLFGIRRSPEGEWWHGLWGFPRSASVEALQRTLGDPRVERVGSFSHVVTDHDITVELSVARTATQERALTWVSDSELADYALPTPQRKALALVRAHLFGLDGQPSLFNAVAQDAVDEHEREAIEA